MPYITLGDAEVAYEERGKGEPLILVHGWSSSRKQWLLNLKALAPRYRAIAVDLPGFGESEENDYPYTRDGMASFLDAFAGALHLSSFHLLGHSLGGCISIRYTVLHPGKVRKLVLVSTPTRTASMGVHALLPGAQCFISHTYRFRNEDMLKWMFYRGLYQPEYQDLDFVRANVKANTLATRRALSESTRLVRRMDLADDLRRIEQPTLIVFGDKDKSVNPREALRQRSILANPYMTILTACAHCPPYERPELFNTVVMDFLEAEGLEDNTSDTPSPNAEG
ncbi:MAG: alpha/beta hydrolase [Actinobacteria bacterium]|jgi:pimeloyl-ACP methyl ester carboxylesterase|nr:MAG: alpha/beta hydrolase [Actinomycetota bacterium]